MGNHRYFLKALKALPAHAEGHIVISKPAEHREKSDVRSRIDPNLLDRRAHSLRKQKDQIGPEGRHAAEISPRLDRHVRAKGFSQNKPSQPLWKRMALQVSAGTRIPLARCAAESYKTKAA
jgi:hypothetical protein